MDPIAAYQTHTCLVDALHVGTGSPAVTDYKLGEFVAGGKTGTHYEFKDLWFLGYTSGVTCGVWAGFDKQKTIYPGAFSNRIVLPVWVDMMNASVARYVPQEIEPAADRRTRGDVPAQRHARHRLLLREDQGPRRPREIRALHLL
jgi:membrane carboxypeptidase/penicillin-binding protein